MRQQVTIKDVAQLAGCGVASVSRVLNNTGPSSADLRARVHKAAEELGFEFSEVGRSLQSSTTRTIGCIVPSLANPVFADAVQGVQETAQSAGYQTLLVCTNYDPESETKAIKTLMAKQVDGLVLTVSDVVSSDGLKTVQQRGIPHCLLFNAAPQGSKGWSVDDRAAAMSVAQIFSEAGHRHVGFLALRFRSSDRARLRHQGFVDGCAKNGMSAPALLKVDEDSENLTELLQEFLHDNPSLSGIFASNDFLALAIIRSARALGLNVPGDLSIIGFDGIEVGTMVDPSLATIATDPKLMGSGAAGTVLALIDNTEAPVQPEPEFSFSFRAGGSLAPPAAERTDDEKAATSSPSNNHTKKNANFQLERSK